MKSELGGGLSRFHGAIVGGARAEDATRAMPTSDAGFRSLEGMLDGPMEVGIFLCIAIAIASALGRVHQRRVVHKDIKPANILVNRDGREVRLTGFGLASHLPRERQAPEPPEFIAGTLAYMAPEQTGRMNRSIDSRSDLYALGVTLYQMLTGSLPFTATDPMEWVHCHIARKPVSPSERLENVPAAVSAIIMRLLVKTPEDRYQAAGGVGHDLRRCLAAWEAERRIDDFPLGERDTPDQLLIPEKLYGRSREVETLLTAFDRMVTGATPELVLVSGYSGIGKSSVVNELHKVLVPPRGLFASGKFDQYKRDIPYATLAQAFQSLVQRLLGKSEADLTSWRDAFRGALGPNGRLMIELVPELELIIGHQPPAPDLPPHDARRRFQLIFRRFVGVFARQEHPLALFLDDLQWLDAATLDLLEDLLTGSDLQHLMLIGAYRSNEVSSSHPLRQKLEAIEAAGGKVVELTLAPLTPEHLRQLISDALRCETERAAPLAQLVHEKTGGNPFFANRFIGSLAEEGMLTFDHDAARWSWDLGRIHAKGYTDNLADLMVGKLTRLTTETQKAVQQLACLGNAAAAATLSLVCGATETEIHSLLEEAVRAELLERRKDSYRFIHDRIQEAAYLLVPDSVRLEAHLRIGRLLAANTPPEQREEAIYEIVNQLNRGALLITSGREREQLAELNLIAGKRAKASTAYRSALNYLVAGQALLPEDCWERKYRLVFAMEVARAECEFLTGDLTAAEERLSTLSIRAANLVDKAAVACLRTALYTTLARVDRAVEICVEYLRKAGVACSPQPTDEEVSAEYERLLGQLGGRSIEALFDLPLMSDPGWRATMEVLTELSAPAYFADANLFGLVLLRMANLSVEHGNCDGSCLAYSLMNTVLGGRFGNYPAGLRFGELSLDLVEKKGLERFKARVYLGCGCSVIPWARHIREGVPLNRRSLETALQAGDQIYAAFAYSNLVTNRLTSAEPLAEVQREAESALEFAQNSGFAPGVAIVTAQLCFIRTVRGLTREFGSFCDDGFDEARFEGHLGAGRSFVVCWYWIRKLQARFYAGAYAQAVAAAAKARPLLPGTSGLFEEADYHFYAALARAAASDSATPDERREHSGALAEHHKRLALWAENCPENFANRAALVGAEIARIDGRVVDAEQLYEQAIRSAHEHGFVQNEGLAYELAARFYAARGFDEIAHLYLGHARQGYLRWGADGKVRQLDELYPRLRQYEPILDSRATIATPVERLGLATVLKVSQAVSGEIVLDRLVETLLRTAIEQAGAERGLLILPHGGELSIQAEAKTDGSSVTVRLCETPVSAQELPESIVRYAARTQESVILDDALARNPFSSDEYIREQRPRSVLCLPLVKQGVLVALLYMENNLGPGFFSPDRIVVLKVLASQAAISLDNSRLYRELQEREGRIRRLVDANIIGVLISDAKGEIIESNDAYLKMVGYTREELVSGRMRWRSMTPPEWKVASEQGVTQVETTGVCKVFEKEYYRKDGSRVPVLVGAARFEKSSTVAFAVDLTERKRAEALLAGEKRILEMVARGDSLPRILESLCELVEEQAEGVLASVLLAQNGRLVHGGAPSLPKAYVDAIDGAAIGPSAGSCGTAAHRGEQVIVSDIAADPLWADYREAALSFALRACWSTPIFSSEGNVIGTFAMYYREPRSPSAYEQEIIEQITHLAGVAIQRKVGEEKLRRSQHYLAEAQKVGHTGSWAWSSVCNVLLYWSEECYRILGYDPAQGLPSFESSFERIHPEDRPAVAEAMERAVREKAAFQIEYRLVLPDGTRRDVRAVSHPVLDASGMLVEFVGTIMDVTEQKRAEEERREHLWFLESMDRINRAMQRSNELELMMGGVLEEALAIFGCERACLVYPCDPDTPTWRVVVERATPEYAGDFALGEEFPVSREGAEVFRRALQESGPLVDPKMRPDRRAQFHIASMITFAVRPRGDRPYLFVMQQCSSPRAWSAVERRLFEEIARRLEDTLTSVLAHRNLLASQEALQVLSRDLQESNTKLEEAQRIAHVGYWEWDVLTGRVNWSDETYRIYGMQPQERSIDITACREKIHPKDWQRAEGALDGARFSAECRLFRPTGEVRIAHFQGDVNRDASGKPYRMFGTIEDVTDRRRAEEERRAHVWFLESMDRINRAMQRTNDTEDMMSGVLDETLAIFGCDRAWLVYPCDPDAATSRVVMEHTRPEYPGAFALDEEFPVDAQGAQVMRRVLDGPGAVTDLSVSPEILERFSIQSVIAIAVRPKGDRPYLFGLHQCSHARAWTASECRLFEEIARRLEDALTSVLAHRNLLAREEELSRSQAYLAEAQKVSHTGSWSFNADGFGHWSPELFKIHGFDPGRKAPTIPEYLGLVHPEDRDLVAQEIEKMLAGAERFDFKKRIVRPDGAIRHVRCVGIRATVSGIAQEFVGTGMDVTEQVRSEEELRNAREKLAQASKIASFAELSASIAHEINQPLQAIVANGHASLRWLDATPPDIKKAIRTAKRMVRDGNAAAEVVSRIRALFKHAAPAKVDLDINKLIVQVRTLMADEIQGNGVSVKTELGKDVPRIRADAVQIQQVIVNLVRNAIEAMVGAPRKPLLIRSRRSASHVAVDVRDQGTGLVDPQKIFEPFVSTKETGMGMGLTICRSIIEAHAGDIRVVHNDGPGVTFSFSLPIEALDA